MTEIRCDNLDLPLAAGLQLVFAPLQFLLVTRHEHNSSTFTDQQACGCQANAAGTANDETKRARGRICHITDTSLTVLGAANHRRRAGWAEMSNDIPRQKMSVQSAYGEVPACEYLIFQRRMGDFEAAQQ